MLEALLVEDDEVYSEEMRECMAGNNFAVTTCATQDAMMSLVQSRRFDLIVLDQRLGQRDMLSAVSELRRVHEGALVFLSGNTAGTDRIIALELGADDFIHKSLTIREILARLRAVARRNPAAQLAAPVPVAGAMEAVWRLDPASHELVSPQGRSVRLTPPQFTIMRAFAEQPGLVIDRHAFYEMVFHRPYQTNDRALDNMISRLRSKVDPEAKLGDIIKCVRGTGYILVSMRVEMQALGPLPTGEDAMA